MDILRSCIIALLLSLPVLSFAGQTININTANKDLLMSIKGIGEKRAEAIIAYRNKNGPFKTVDQLAEIKGVGKLFIDSNRDVLVVKDTGKDRKK